LTVPEPRPEGAGTGVISADLEESLVLPEETIGTWTLAFRRLRHHKLAMLGLAVLIFFMIASLLAPVIAPYPYDAIDLQNRLSPPSRAHLFGTDDLGRDTFTRILYAGRISLSVALTVTIISAVVGTSVGSVSGYLGGTADTVLMRFTDVMLTLPVLPLLMIMSKSLREMPGLQQRFGTALSVLVIIVVIAVFDWMSAARLVHGAALSLKEQEFMEAARALGVSGPQTIIRHLVPNSLAPIIVAATFSFGGTVIYEATLSFLGLGIQPPTPSWGNMLTDVQRLMMRNPWLAFYPGLCIFFTVLSVNFLGDGLRDALDPRLKI
jgi:peptide/nickel transport system permease protein